MLQSLQLAPYFLKEKTGIKRSRGGGSPQFTLEKGTSAPQKCQNRHQQRGPGGLKAGHRGGEAAASAGLPVPAVHPPIHRHLPRADTRLLQGRDKANPAQTPAKSPSKKPATPSPGRVYFQKITLAATYLFQCGLRKAVLLDVKRVFYCSKN